MTVPNLYVVIHNIFSPRRWFSKQKKSKPSSGARSDQPLAASEHWKSPVPGVYRHKPGLGWFLIQLDSDPSKPEKPDRVHFCAALDRGILESEYAARSMKAKLPIGCSPVQSRSSSRFGISTQSSPTGSRNNSLQEAKCSEVNFVCHDDGVTWLNDRDAIGNPTKGPWQRFCIDNDTGEMRVMLKKDLPTRREKKRQATCLIGDERNSQASPKKDETPTIASSISAGTPESDDQLKKSVLLWTEKSRW